MEKEHGFKPKQLSLSYEQFEQKGSTIENMMIDKYVVYDLIGLGSFGSVFRGMDDHTKKQVAVKLINMRQIKKEKNQVTRQIRLRLAESQPKLMYMCDSPYLLKCFDVYENEDLKVLIIEFCNGTTLQSEIEQKKRISQNDAWIILKHIINGLMVLHSHNIVHRDIKADNIMSHNGTYKIIDFGFSKKLEVLNSQTRNTSLGTITTMAPEVMGRKPYGLKADIWSVGIIFFQMIYGQYPYDSSSAPQMYREIQTKRLFNKEQPFKFNGYTPSQQAYNFLRTTIVVETKNRPDWRGVADYPNIKKVDDEIHQRFINQCEVEVTNQLDYQEALEEDRPTAEFKLLESKKGVISKQFKEEKMKENGEGKRQEIKLNEERRQNKYIEKEEDRRPTPPKKKNKINLDQAIRQQKEQKERRQTLKKVQKESNGLREQKRPVIRGMNRTQLQKKQKQIDNQQQRQYNWTQQAHLQCLKTQFVFRQIVYPLEISTLDLQQRSTVQFYYLLAARCFNNMSPVHEELQERTSKGKNVDIINNLNSQITHLYKQIHQKFIHFSQKLTKQENKVGSMFKDWFSKKVDKQNFKQKDNFMTGIQRQDYTKEDQINFTYTYYKESIRETIVKTKNSMAIQNKLNNYPRIMMVKLKELKQLGMNFQEFVKEIAIKK